MNRRKFIRFIIALTARDAETRFKLMAAAGIPAALGVLKRLDGKE